MPFTALQVRLLSAAAAAALALGAAAEARAQEEVELAFSVPVGRPLFVQVATTVNATVTMTTKKGGTRSAPLESVERQVFVDEYRILEKSREEAVRYYAYDERSQNGRVSDGIFNGLEVLYTRKGEDIVATLGGDRRAADEDLNWLLKCFPSLGIWVELPTHAKVGDSFKLDLKPIVPVLSTGDLVCKAAEGQIKLVSHDAGTRVARLEGKVTILQDGDLEGIATKADLAGTCTMEVNLAEHRIAWLLLEGTLAMKGSAEGADLKGEGKFRTELVTDVGAAVAKWRKLKPSFRKRPYRIHALSVELELPSYFSRVSREPPKTVLFRTVDVDDKLPVIVLEPVLDTSPAKDFFEAQQKAFKQSFPGVKAKKVKSGLGEGRAFTFNTKEDGVKYTIQVELYPWEGKYLIFKLVGTASGFRKGLKEFEQARATLRQLAD